MFRKKKNEWALIAFLPSWSLTKTLLSPVFHVKAVETVF